MTQSSSFSLFKRSACEGLATAMLVAAVVGSGILGERLSGGNTAIALLANTIATGAALAALILAFGQFSGAHLNPAVSVALALRGLMPWGEVPFYVAAPLSTIDLSLKRGEDIPIEERDGSEVLMVNGKSIAPKGTKAAHFAFDVTPGRLINAIITEKGILRSPFEFSLAKALEGEER